MRKPTRGKNASSLAGKLALVTGANRGIGLEIALALAGEGCDLILTARDQKSLAQVARRVEKLKVHVVAETCDVRSPESVDGLFFLVRALRRPIDFLINNAGIAHTQAFITDLPYPIWRDVIETNLTGLFLVTQAALAVMKQGSVIVNNLSVAAERVFPGSAAYNASKHGGLGFTDTLREELRPKGIRVMALLPGATDTDIWKTLWPRAPRRKMMPASAVASIVVNALRLPANSAVEKIIIRPSAGTL